mmetsp:Transcript_21870/g.19413  ORF Transcript_21870/g.19413 Transcript_21870/m.19413 type:complete len:290 (-) Transcript_21870:22-891(-)
MHKEARLLILCLRLIINKLTSLKEEISKQESETADSEEWRMSREQIQLFTGEGLYEKDFQDSQLQLQDVKLEALSTRVEVRPFQMMKRICETMDKGGGYLTKTLFIPKYIWFQKKTLITEIEKKVEYCETIQKEFKKVGIIYRKNCLSKEKTEIQNLVNVLHHYKKSIYTDFPSIMPYYDESKKSESTWNKISKGIELIAHKITKGAFITSTREYAKCLKDLFIETYFIEDLCKTDFDEDLAYICEFVNEVVVALALSDIKFLTREYLKVMKKESLLKSMMKARHGTYN